MTHPNTYKHFAGILQSEDFYLQTIIIELNELNSYYYCVCCFKCSFHCRDKTSTGVFAQFSITTKRTQTLLKLETSIRWQSEMMRWKKYIYFWKHRSKRGKHVSGRLLHFYLYTFVCLYVHIYDYDVDI